MSAFDSKDVLPLEVGGPYPSVSIITCVDGGSTHPEYAEPPAYECLALIHQAQDQDSEQPKEALELAEFIVTACNAHDRLERQNAELLEALQAAREEIERIMEEHLEVDPIGERSVPLVSFLNKVIVSVEGGEE